MSIFLAMTLLKLTVLCAALIVLISPILALRSIYLTYFAKIEIRREFQEDLIKLPYLTFKTIKVHDQQYRNGSPFGNPMPVYRSRGLTADIDSISITKVISRITLRVFGVPFFK